MHRPAAAPRSALILTLALGACAGPSAIPSEAEPEDSLIGGEISSRPADAEAPAPGDLPATAARLDLDLRLVSDSTGELAAITGLDGRTLAATMRGLQARQRVVQLGEGTGARFQLTHLFKATT